MCPFANKNDYVRLNMEDSGKKFYLNPFQRSTVFHIETSRLICIANQMSGFYKKCNTGLKGAKTCLGHAVS